MMNHTSLCCMGLVLAAIVGLAGNSQAAMIGDQFLINHRGEISSDNVGNSWNWFETGEGGAFSGKALLTSTGATSGLTMNFAEDDNGFYGGGTPGETLFTGKPAGFEWFDESIEALRQTRAVDKNDGYVEYSFHGFDSRHDVQFDFVMGRSGDNDRRMTLFHGSEPIFDEAQTASQINYGSITLTGSDRYTFRAEYKNNDHPAALPNAMRISIIPEPDSFVMMAMALLGLVFGGRCTKCRC